MRGDLFLAKFWEGEGWIGWIGWMLDSVCSKGLIGSIPAYRQEGVQKVG